MGEEVDGRYGAGSPAKTGCSLKVVIPDGWALLPPGDIGQYLVLEMLLVVTLVLGR